METVIETCVSCTSSGPYSEALTSPQHELEQLGRQLAVECLDTVLLDRVETLEHVASDKGRAATSRLDDSRGGFGRASSVLVVVEDGDDGSISPASCTDTELAKDPEHIYEYWDEQRGTLWSTRAIPLILCHISVGLTGSSSMVSRSRWWVAMRA